MRYLVTAVLCIAGVSLSSVSNAQSSSILDLMNEAVSGAPSVEIARADTARAQASATRIALSPYEYQLSGSVGQRFIDDPLAPNTEFTEYGAGVSKTIRLPSKKRLDQRLSQIEIEIAELGVEVAAFEEKLAFIKLWNAWSQAYRFVPVSQRHAADAAELAQLEVIKVEKGAGRQINADVLLAQSQIAEVLAEQDVANAERAKLNLVSRYPMIDLPYNPLSLSPSISAIAGSQLDEPVNYPAQRLAALQSERLRLRAQREGLNKRPDPTVGLAVTDEFGGRETSVMATLSIPLGGKLRRATVNEAQAQALKSEVEARLSYQMAERDFKLSQDTAKSYDRLIAAAEAAREASRASLVQMEKGYALGAITAQEMIIARQSLRDAERSYAEYAGQAEAAKLLLLVYTSAK